MLDTTTKTIGSSASTVVVDGLAELTKEEKIAKIQELQAAKKASAAETRKRQARFDRLVDLRDGTNLAGKNPKLRQNPGLMPETLRQTGEDELINGSPAKGWAVTVRCQHVVRVPEHDENHEELDTFCDEICGTDRVINTQDAFQTRFCEDHKGEAAKAKARARRAAKKTEELAQLSDEDLDAQLAALSAQAA